MADGQVVIDVDVNGKDVTGLNKQLNQLEGSSDKAGFSIKNLVVSMGLVKVASAAISTSVNAIKGAFSNAISEGAKLEQSIGGVETLFKENAGIVKNYANQAFKTAGVSANEYMENVTSFSASLISSLGGDTKKAAELANTAMIDMSDNANKMGTDMEAVTQTYQSLARGNYAMLDNLKLGYGGTKSEMERLMKDAEKLTGEHYTIGDFADTVKAIHAVQENLGITGTTAKEAATTISGSFASMKAAMQNVLGKMAIGEDIKDELNELATTTSTFLFGNFIPMVGNILKALPEAIVTFIKAAIPHVKAAFGELLSSISSNFPILGQLFDFISKNAQAFKLFASVIVGAIAGFMAFKGAISIFNSVKVAITGVKAAFTAMKVALLANPFGLILAAVGALTAGLIYLYKTNDNVRNSINNLIGKAKEMLNNFIKSESVSKLFADGLKLISSIGDKVASIIGNIGKNATNSASSIDWFGIAFKTIKAVILALLGPIGLAIKAFELIAKTLGGGDIGKGIDTIMDSFSGLADGIKTYGPQLGSNFGTALEGILTAIGAALPGIISGGLQVVAGFISGLAQGFPQLAVAAAQLITSFTAAVVLLIPTIVLAATSIITSFLGAITVALPQIIAAGAGLINALLQGITQQLPTLVGNMALLITTWLISLNAYMPMIMQAGFNLLITFLQGIANNIGQVTQKALDIVINFAQVIAQNMPTIVNTAVNLMVNFVNSLASRMPDIVKSAVNLIVNFVNGIASNLQAIINAAVNLIVAFLRGIASRINTIVNAAMDLVDAMVRGIIQAQGRLMDAAITLINGFANNIRSRQEEVRGAALNLLDAIIGVFVPDSLYSTGKNIIQGLINGIGSMVGAVTAKISEVAGNIKDKITGALGIHSPSRWMRDYVGKFIPQGIAVGIEADAKSAYSAMNKLSNGLMNSITPESALGTSRMGMASVGSRIVNNTYNNQKQLDVEKLAQVIAKHPVRVSSYLDGTLVGDNMDQRFGKVLNRRSYMRGE
ncbi:TPA: hypothetical protein ACQJMJ_000360 [Enterococcus faecium]|uniref:phage tail protein n=1 Tax=Enterococcus faecium TaxID=1352 RepID=UPI00204AB4BB|nr:hypothetical protein [Enterococcus faecium]BDP64753.1 hypothetical protein EfmJHP80_22490 [Enterococcus faecium]DAH94213.1 MAG TPA: tail tape measure protein [Caudoviricetes sp.]